MLLSPKFHTISLYDSIRDWTIAISRSFSIHQGINIEWITSPIGQLKVNFDGSAKGNPSPASLGVLFRMKMVK